MTRIPDDVLADLKARNPINKMAEADGVRLRRRRSAAFGPNGYAGPCPLCSVKLQSKTAGRFDCNADSWACAVCQKGGDAIEYVRLRDGVSFREAIERLGGAGFFKTAASGLAPVEMTPLLAHRMGRADHARGITRDAGYDAFYERHGSALRGSYLTGWDKAETAARAETAYRERERARLRAWWLEAAPFCDKTAASGLSPRNPVAAYLAGRGLEAPANAKLRFHPDIPLFADGRENEPRLLHRGPVMLAAIIGTDGKFAGLHITWLDPRGPQGKLCCIDPETMQIMPSKKSRGSKAGGYIDLGCVIGSVEGPTNPAAAAIENAASRLPVRMFAGEGIETVLAVFTALKRAGRLRVGDRFRCGIDLGNLAGRALSSVTHPDLKTAAGRARRVPGPDPDMTAPAMPVPDDVSELVGLGDGDSDPFTTRQALACFKARHSRPGRTIRTPIAASGKDFNDMLQCALQDKTTGDK